MPEGEKKIAIAVPGEWALQKAFGPALTEIGEDLRKLYAKGRDKLISTAYRKIHDVNDGKQGNLRVTRDVLWNGAFTEDEVCAEYFGGIFAASRSVDGKEDDAIQFVDVIKSLSAKQLRLRYVIYNSLNKLLVAAGKPVNVALDREIQAKQVWFASIELIKTLSLKIETDLNILHRQGLLHEYRTNTHAVSEKQLLPYAFARPTNLEFSCMLSLTINSKNGAALTDRTLAISPTSHCQLIMQVRWIICLRRLAWRPARPNQSMEPTATRRTTHFLDG
jgi:hypothetical protein